MTNKTELLPCPFCGGPGKLCVADYVHDDGSPWPIVECDTCHGWVPASVWNTRAAPAQDVRAVADEPVAWVNPSNLARFKGDIGATAYQCADHQIPLYRHPQRPVVLPERFDMPHRDEYESADHHAAAVHEANTWNACIDEFERLNK